MNTAAAGGGQFNSRLEHRLRDPDRQRGRIVSQIRTGNETDKVHIGDRALLGVQVQDLNSPNAATPSQIAPVNSGALVTGVQGNTGATPRGHPGWRRHHLGRRQVRHRLVVTAPRSRCTTPATR